MNITQFNALLKTKQREIANYAQRVAPTKIGNLARRHVMDDFRKGGHTHNGFEPWPETQRQKNGTGAGSQYGPLTSGRNHLMNSIEYAPGLGVVNIFTRVPYAATHNFGGTITARVTDKMRRYAWAKHFEEAGGDKKKDTMWKGLALTRKNTITINIPKRQFMPVEGGKELVGKVQNQIERDLTAIFKQ